MTACPADLRQCVENADDGFPGRTVLFPLLRRPASSADRVPCRRSRSGSRRSRKRAAFTLFEMLMVLSVVAVIASLSWPRLTSFLKQQQLIGSAEQVRQLLDRARLEAVEQGIILQARFEPEGQKYVLLPFDAFQEQPQQSQSKGVVSTSFTDPSGSRSTGRDRRPTYRVQELNEVCHFHTDRIVAGDTSGFSRLGEQWLGHLEDGLAARDAVWTRPILYYPDGSATDGVVTVMDREKRYVRLHIRGLTGAVIATKVAKSPEVFGATTN